MKTRFTQFIRRHGGRAVRLLVSVTLLCAVVVGANSCDSSGAYWGVDQNYPIGNGSMYYGAYGGSSPHYGHPGPPRHGWSKKQYKKYKKYCKKREKEYRKQMKKARHYKKHHHDDD